MKLLVSEAEWAYASVFCISNSTKTHVRTIVVELEDRGVRGRGEALGVWYKGETIEGVQAQIESVRRPIERGLTRTDLQSLLPAGGARNAVDCALWDLEAKKTGRRVWDLLGVSPLKQISTDLTLSLDTPSAMAASATVASHVRTLKIKLGGEGDVERVEAVRSARPDAELIVDANQAWNEAQLADFVPRLAKLGVRLIEQPMPVGKDEALRHFASPTPLCADESCQTSADLDGLIGKYTYVNIKLDKTGGLTEALNVVRKAKRLGLGLMVGCMGGSSLSMAPGFVIAQHCDFVDLDAPLLTTSDVPFAITYDGGAMAPPVRDLWG